MRLCAIDLHAGAGPYHCFVTEQFKGVASSMAPGPRLQQQVSKQLGAMWRRLPQEGRKRYQELCAKNQATAALLESVVSRSPIDVGRHASAAGHARRVSRVQGSTACACTNQEAEPHTRFHTFRQVVCRCECSSRPY